MHKFFLTLISAVLLIVSFTPAYAGGEDELLGLGLGGALGGLFGNQFGHGSGRVATTVGGVVLGGWAGDEIGRSLDRSDSYYPSSSGAPYAPVQLFDTPQVPYDAPNYVAPSAPDPAAIYTDSSYGVYCRQFSQQVRVSDHVQESYGTACLQPDGSWQMLQ